MLYESDVQAHEVADSTVVLRLEERTRDARAMLAKGGLTVNTECLRSKTARARKTWTEHVRSVDMQVARNWRHVVIPRTTIAAHAWCAESAATRSQNRASTVPAAGAEAYI